MKIFHIIICYKISILFCIQLHSMQNITLETFDALSYLKQIPQDVQQLITSYWYHYNPVQLQVKPYSPQQKTNNYPWTIDQYGIVTVQNNTGDKKMSFGLNGIDPAAHWLFKSTANKTYQPINIWGPDNSGTIGFVDNQLWVIPTGERFMFSVCVDSQDNNFKTADLYAGKMKSDLALRRTYPKFTPCALAANGSRCIFSTKYVTCITALIAGDADLNHRLWMCDITPSDKAAIDFTQSSGHDQGPCIAEVKKICDMGTAYENQTICMPSVDTAVIYNHINQEVKLITYMQNVEPTSDTVLIPEKHALNDLYCIDYLPNKFALDMSYNGSRILGIYSLESAVHPLFISLQQFGTLDIAPHRSTKQTIKPNAAQQDNLYISARSPEEWYAYVLLHAAQQLHEKNTWDTSDTSCANVILKQMQNWSEKLKNHCNATVLYPTVNPYYLCWLARTADGKSNYFRDLYHCTPPNNNKPQSSNKVRPYTECSLQ